MNTRPAFVVSALFLFVALATSARSASVPAPLCGDVNNTGSLGPTDALAVLRASVGQEVSLTCGECPAALVYGITEAVPPSTTFLGGYLVGGAVDVLQAMTMTQIGIIARSPGNLVKAGLYTDDNGVPAKLLVGTEATVLLDGAQAIEVPATELAAGTYWIMTAFDADTAIPGDENNQVASVYYETFEFSGPLPESLGTGGTYLWPPMPYSVKGVP